MFTWHLGGHGPLAPLLNPPLILATLTIQYYLTLHSRLRTHLFHKPLPPYNGSLLLVTRVTYWYPLDCLHGFTGLIVLVGL